MTPHIKHLLRVKNRLMRQGRVEKAHSLAERILKMIIVENVRFFSQSNPIKDTRDLWSRVKQVTGKDIQSATIDPNITADELNKHYADVSTDKNYEQPLPKLTVCKDC